MRPQLLMIGIFGWLGVAPTVNASRWNCPRRFEELAGSNTSSDKQAPTQHLREMSEHQIWGAYENLFDDSGPKRLRYTWEPDRHVQDFFYPVPAKTVEAFLALPEADISKSGLSGPQGKSAQRVQKELRGETEELDRLLSENNRKRMQFGGSAKIEKLQRLATRPRVVIDGKEYVFDGPGEVHAVPEEKWNRAVPKLRVNVMQSREEFEDGYVELEGLGASTDRGLHYKREVKTLEDHPVRIARLNANGNLVGFIDGKYHTNIVLGASRGTLDGNTAANEARGWVIQSKTDAGLENFFVPQDSLHRLYVKTRW